MTNRCEISGTTRRPAFGSKGGLPPLRNRISHFAHDEEGSLVVFGLILFVLMTIMGGVAVDLMRFEQQRTQMQQTLDRSVLAAASMSQTLPAVDVVNDYFAKAGLSQYLDGVTAPPGLNYRSVSAKAKADVPTYFMHMIDIDNIEANAASAAEQRITNVEVSMVLDISGSMQNTPSRITNLKAAAKEFVDTVLANDTSQKLSLSLVPYNGQVNLGPDLRGQFTTSYVHGYPDNHCLDIPTSAYNSESISRTTARAQSGHFDSYSAGGQTDSYWQNNRWNYTEANYYKDPQPLAFNGTSFTNVWCQPELKNIVRPFQNDAVKLKGYIDDFIAVGATSIDLGMKWGLTLLSPDTQPAISAIAGPEATKVVPAEFAIRPLSWTADDSMKVIVLMTDGEHFAEEQLNSSYRTANSPIYLDKKSGKLSIRHYTSGTQQYWIPSLNSGSGGWQQNVYNTGNGTTRLTWHAVWKDYRMQWIAWQFYARALATSTSARSTKYTETMNLFRQQISTTAMNTRLQDVCNQAKGKGVIVYGVAFEAPANGKTQIENCATSSSHYFDVTGLQIQTAFRSIASNISQLRLTQ